MANKKSKNKSKKSGGKGKKSGKKEKRRNIVRIMKKDLNAEHGVERGIKEIKGIGDMMARAIRVRSEIPPEKKLKDLSDKELESIEKMLENIEVEDLPKWLLNRRKDFVEGADTHNFEADLMLTKRKDLERMKKIKSYKGRRHIQGLRVRGQKTKSTGRREKTVGVEKKKKKAEAAAGENE